MKRIQFYMIRSLMFSFCVTKNYLFNKLLGRNKSIKILKFQLHFISSPLFFTEIKNSICFNQTTHFLGKYCLPKNIKTERLKENHLLISHINRCSKFSKSNISDKIKRFLSPFLIASYFFFLSSF